MEPTKLQSSTLFTYSKIDFRDKLEERYERAFQNLQNSLHGPNPKELNVIITTISQEGKTQAEDLQISLIYLLLTDVQLAPQALRDILIVTRDGLEFLLAELSNLINIKFQKLAEIAKHQVLWLFKELLKTQGSNVKINGFLWSLLRQASGGDVSTKNVNWIEGILDILIEQRSRFDKYPNSVSLVAYCFVRLIEDHNAPILLPLRNKEVKFTVSLIRERFQDMIPLGRDFIRLLQNVARIPEFNLLWKDILNNPKTLNPQFTGVFQMLATRTSRHFIANRITPEIEAKLIFLTSSVKFGNHKKYQDWFQEKYFPTNESQSLRSDVIRFIINAIHPTNELLSSDIMPRWAILGWLLTSCTNPVALTNAKLAVFYDWLCFDAARDNIMNIEPGILVMYHSIKNVPMVSSTCLDFLCRIMKNFFPKGEERIRAGVYNSLRTILDKQVIPNLVPLFESSKLDRDLRMMVRENFKEFLPTTPTFNVVESQPSNHFHVEDIKVPNKINHNNNSNSSSNNNNSIGTELTVSEKKSSIADDDNPKFSDDDSLDEKKLEIKCESDEDEDDDDLPLSKVIRLKEKPGPDKVDLPSVLKDSFAKFISTKTLADFETFLSEYRVNAQALDGEQEAFVLANILSIIKSTIPEKCDVKELENESEQKLEQLINYPLYGIYKIINQHEEKDKKCNVVLKTLSHCYSRLPNMGFLLLFYLKVTSRLGALKNNQKVPTTFRASVYKLFHQWVSNNSKSSPKIDVCLERDLQQMEQYSVNILLWLLTDIYREFETHVVNNSEILKIVVGCIDARNLHDLTCDITQGKITMFKNDGVLKVIRESLEFETFEQLFFWQLLTAHDVPISSIQDIIPELDSSNSEALLNMQNILKKEEPSDDLVKLLLSRETTKGDPFVTSALIHWCMLEYEGQLSEIIANLLISKISQNSPKKRARALKSNSQANSGPSAEQLLSHLEHLRKCCSYGNNTNVTAMYIHEKMQRALQQAFASCDERQKKQYSELFSLAVEDDTTVNRRGASSRGRKPQAKKETNSNSTTTTTASNKKAADTGNNNKYSSDESSEDDRGKSSSKPQPAKRRKKISQLSDSE